MQLTIDAARKRLTEALKGANVDGAEDISWAAIWLEACGYPGLKLLAEALTDERRDLPLWRDLIGLDLQNVSCAFLAPAIISDVKTNGRVFLRNVRHGLVLLPFTVKEGLAIGCPVDPAFAVGGERLKDPYAEKLAEAEARGLAMDDGVWASLCG